MQDGSLHIVEKVKSCTSLVKKIKDAIVPGDTRRDMDRGPVMFIPYIDVGSSIHKYLNLSIRVPRLSLIATCRDELMDRSKACSFDLEVRISTLIHQNLNNFRRGYLHRRAGNMQCGCPLPVLNIRVAAQAEQFDNDIDPSVEGSEMELGIATAVAHDIETSQAVEDVECHIQEEEILRILLDLDDVRLFNVT